MAKQRKAIRREQLVSERKKAGLSQKALANMLDVGLRTIGRWEQGVQSPHPEELKRLCDLFQKDPQDLGFYDEQFPDSSIFVDPSSPIYDPMIPPPLNDHLFVGRSHLVEKLIKQDLCSDERGVLVALLGLPGVGKSTLAAELAHEKTVREYFSGGILWAGLGQNPNEKAILRRWGRCLGLSEAELRRLQEREDWTEAIRKAIGERKMLLIIDDLWSIEAALNFEKLGGPFCAYIITTRLTKVATHYPGGKVVEVGELSEDDSLALLAQLAPTVVETEPEDIRELIQCVGGLPLAIILIGSSLAEHTSHKQERRRKTVLKRLLNAKERLALERLLKNPRDISQPMPTSLNLIIELSDKALDFTARRMLRTLSVFLPKPNTFSEEAALAVARLSVEVLDRLVDAEMVEPMGHGRYTLHQTIADYAQQKRTENTSENNLVAYFLQFIETHMLDYPHLELEISNVIESLELSQKRDMKSEFIKIINSFYPFLMSQGLYKMAEGYLEQAKKLAETENLVVRIEILLKLATIAEKRDLWAEAEQYIQEGLSLVQQGEDPHLLCVLYNHQGQIQIYKYENLDQAEEFFQKGLELARQMEDTEGQIINLQGLGTLNLNYRRKFHEAKSYYLKELKLARSVENREKINVTLENLSVVAYYLRDYEDAEKSLQEALRLAKEMNHRGRICSLLENLGWVAITRSNYTQALEYLQEGIAEARKLNQPQLICGILSALGSVAILMGEFEIAREYQLEGLSLAERADPFRIHAFLQNLGEIAYHCKEYKESEEYLKRGLKMVYEHGDREKINGFLASLGELAARKGQFKRAKTYYQNALNLARVINYPLLESGLLNSMGWLYLKGEQYGESKSNFVEALKIARENKFLEYTADALFGLACIAFGEGKYDEARDLGRESLGLFTKLGHYKLAEVIEWLQTNLKNI